MNEENNGLNSNNQQNNNEVVSEDILAQQPLMASLMQSESVQQFGVPRQNDIPKVEDSPQVNENIILPVSQPEMINNSENNIVEEQDMSMYQPPSIEAEKSDESVPEEKKKKKFNWKPLIIVLVVIVLGLGIFFGYRKIFSGLNPFVKPIDNLADAVEYFENKLDIKLTQDKDLMENTNYVSYESDPENDSFSVSVVGEKDGRLTKVNYYSKDQKLNKMISIMTPFMKNYKDSKIANSGVKLAKKYGEFSYSGMSYFGIIKEDDGYFIDVEYHKDDEIDREIELVDEDKAIITRNISIMEIALKKKYGKVEFNDFSVVSSLILLSNGDIFEGSKYASVSFDVEIAKLANLPIEESKIVRSESVNMAGKSGYLLVVTEGLKDKEFIEWRFYVASDGSEVDINNSEEKGYYVVGAVFTKDDYLSTDEQEDVLEDAIKSVKMG